jgi:hypothetical protein
MDNFGVSTNPGAVITEQSFSWALREIKSGRRVRRKGWNGKGMWILLVAPTQSYGNGVKNLPWIGMKTADNCFVPWVCSQTDMLVEDWELVE